MKSRYLDYSPILVNIVAFSILFVLFKANYNTAPDGRLAYIFSGGFGIAGSSLVEYAWGWNVIIGSLVKWMFELFPLVNWYSWFLILLHFLGCLSICRILINKFGRSNGLFLYLLFFLFFESSFLLSLTFSNTSIILAIAGNLNLLYAASIKPDNPGRTVLVGSVLVITGALLRFHTWGLVELLFIPFILTGGFKLPQYLRRKAPQLLVITCCYTFHLAYCHAKIETWDSDEIVRQHQYSLYNRAIDSSKVSQLFPRGYNFEFIYKGFLFENKLVIPAEELQKLQKLVMFSRAERIDFASSIRWYFVNNRIYFLFFLWSGIVLFTMTDKVGRTSIMLATGFFFLIQCSFLLFFKIPPYMPIAVLIVNWLFLLTSIRRKFSLRTPVVLSTLVFLCIWLAVRLQKMSERNTVRNRELLSTMEGIRSHSSNIFVSTFANVEFADFSVFDSPRRHLLPNYISGGEMPRSVLMPKLRSLQISDMMAALISRSDVVLLGDSLTHLSSYYLDRYHTSVRQSLLSDSIRSLKMYKVVAQ